MKPRIMAMRIRLFYRNKSPTPRARSRTDRLADTAVDWLLV
jgi:hypothetical protein